MKVLLVSATLLEINPLLAAMHITKRIDDQRSSYQFRKTDIDVLITGIGMTATAFHLGRQLALKTYDLVINAGIAGSFSPDYPPGTVVRVGQERMPDLGAEEGEEIITVFDLGIADPDKFPFSGGRLVSECAARTLSLPPVAALPVVTAITSDTIHGNPHGVSRIRRDSPADIETMEGAAFFYACIFAGSQFLAVRAISNFAGDRDKSQWTIGPAISALSSSILRILHACQLTG